MSKKTRLCRVCHTNPAEVPDRDGPALTFRKEVCRECHARRLGQDLTRVLRSHAEEDQR